MMIYREDDWMGEVEIVKDLSNDEWLSYELKVIRTIRESKIFKPTPVGTIFRCDWRKDTCQQAGGWSLREE